MRRVALTRQFRRDVRRARKRGWDIDHLQRTMERLLNDEVLETRYACHPLRGGFAGHWECHVGPDFLLIWYRSGDDEIVFVRAGSHADLFG
ncbi:MAG: type II toxin-antitoxin system YafQ family toxin [Gemmatimonadaceae bacterium]|nr:type II toxin-antitoxin system YafQ family toxin [Gemmatimonadaceae bacterium]